MRKLLYKLLLIFIACSSPDQNGDDKNQIEKENEASSGLTSPNKIGETPQERVIDLDQGEIYPVRIADPMNGIGIIVMKSIGDGFNTRETIELLNEDNTVYAKWNYHNESFEIEGNISALFSVSDNRLKEDYDFSPRVFFTEYHIIHFEVMNKDGTFYEVLVNPDKGVTKRLSLKSSQFNYFSWEEYLKRLYLSYDPNSNPLRKFPDGQSEIVYKYNDYFFKVIEVKGDWVKIKCSSDCKLCDKGDLAGWVKWKYGKKLLIEIGIIC